jgi:hypothetical protein
MKQDFRVISGVSVPFSILETINGQQIRSLRLDTVTFNTATADVDFEITNIPSGPRLTRAETLLYAQPQW